MHRLVKSMLLADNKTKKRRWEDEHRPDSQYDDTMAGRHHTGGHPDRYARTDERYAVDDADRNAGYLFGVNGTIQMQDHPYHADKLTAAKAEEITRKMVNEDGSKGAHWSMDQTKQVMEQRGIQCDPVEFYVAMNMMYSDYYPVAKKLNVNSVDFYAELARAFLEDKDAGKDKLAKYFAYVVK